MKNILNKIIEEFEGFEDAWEELVYSHFKGSEPVKGSHPDHNTIQNLANFKLQANVYGRAAKCVKRYLQEYRSFQSRVKSWANSCFSHETIFSQKIRNYRFLEEALELVQAKGCSKNEAIEVLNYVFDREPGNPKQEVGGVLLSLSLLCSASEIDMEKAGEDELERVKGKINEIRAKESIKPFTEERT